MWRSTVVPETIFRWCWTFQTHSGELTCNWGRGRTFHELNSLSLVRLMKSSTFRPGLNCKKENFKFSRIKLATTGDGNPSVNAWKFWSYLWRCSWLSGPNVNGVKQLIKPSCLKKATIKHGYLNIIIKVVQTPLQNASDQKVISFNSFWESPVRKACILIPSCTGHWSNKYHWLILDSLILAMFKDIRRE